MRPRNPRRVAQQAKQLSDWKPGVVSYEYKINYDLIEWREEEQSENQGEETKELD